MTSRSVWLCALRALVPSVTQRTPARPPAACPQTHMRLAHVLKAAERPARAAEAYRAALSLQPRHPTANYKLGSVLKQLGRLQAAADAFR